MISQALTKFANLRVIGICDTPVELFHRIAAAAGGPYSEMQLDPAGLNHLGWVRRVLWRGEDIMSRLLDDARAISSLYPANLFDPALVRTLRLIPTEYLFFLYSQRKAPRTFCTRGPAGAGGEWSSWI